MGELSGSLVPFQRADTNRARSHQTDRQTERKRQAGRQTNGEKETGRQTAIPRDAIKRLEERRMKQERTEDKCGPRIN